MQHDETMRRAVLGLALAAPDFVVDVRRGTSRAYGACPAWVELAAPAAVTTSTPLTLLLASER